ncbi:MAG: amidophosphoribosyltransferase, partial [archaeon]
MCVLKEACGVVGAACPEHNVVEHIWHGLLALQHRGQEGNGIFTLDKEKFLHAKHLGLVDDLSRYNSLKGSRGIGHVRYSTTGSSPIQERTDISESQACESLVQPFFVSYPKSGLALCHNGNLVNYIALKRAFKSEGRNLISDSDAEIIVNQLAKELTSTNDLEKAAANIMSSLEGAYSVVALTGENELIAFRDPHGFRPLCYGKQSDLHVFASESVALDAIGASLIDDIKPGEVVVIDKNCDVSRKIVSQDSVAHCMFEYVYFSRPDSIIDGKEVYPTRIRLGQKLAETYKADADVVV